MFSHGTPRREEQNLFSLFACLIYSSPSQRSRHRWLTQHSNCLWQNKALAVWPFRGGEQWKWHKFGCFQHPFVTGLPNLSMISALESRNCSFTDWGSIKIIVIVLQCQLLEQKVPRICIYRFIPPPSYLGGVRDLLYAATVLKLIMYMYYFFY